MTAPQTSPFLSRWPESGRPVACTPHILPGLYGNTGRGIRLAAQELQRILDHENIALHLVTGADAHIERDFVTGLRSGRILSLADSRYVLVEPPHHIAPPRMEEFFFNVMTAGYVPIMTHPERLTWIRSCYQTMKRLVQAGVWLQIKAGSLTGAFGRTAQYWGERLLDEGLVHILATDAHNMRSHPANFERRTRSRGETGWSRRGAAFRRYPAQGRSRGCLAIPSAGANGDRFFFRGGLWRNKISNWRHGSGV
ncbi:MAG: CpsB/CapC family capsule biosynthesis tyrosine phosphatase [Methylocystis silviterrae]|uniref:tyrosine-protein phosphatase n=1 Tax=Methylocystis silviterrae TaxID=2743612 RepID=UPI003C741C29